MKKKVQRDVKWDATGDAEFQAFLSLYVPLIRASFLKARAVLPPAKGPVFSEGSRAWQLSLAEVADKMGGACYFFPPFWQQLAARMHFASRPNAPLTRPRAMAQLIAGGLDSETASMVLQHTDNEARRTTAERCREEVREFFSRAISRSGIHRAKSDKLAVLMVEYVAVPPDERPAWKDRQWRARGFSSRRALTDAVKPSALRKAGVIDPSR